MFFFNHFMDTAIMESQQLRERDIGLLLILKTVGISSIILVVAILLLLIYLFAVGLGGEFGKVGDFFLAGFAGLIIFNLYYLIIYLFFEDIFLEILVNSNRSHLIFDLGDLTYGFYAIWITASLKYTANMSYARSVLAVGLPLSLIFIVWLL